MIEVNEKHESGEDDNFGLSARKKRSKNKNPFCKLQRSFSPKLAGRALRAKRNFALTFG